MGALAVVDFLDRYTGLCSRKKLVAIQSLVNQLQLALNSGDAVDSLVLKGTIPDLLRNRINDDMIDTIVSSFSGGGFLKVLDLSYNEIGDKGAIALAKFIKTDNLLEVLILKSNSIRGAGSSAICGALQVNSQINYLDMSGNDIEEDGGMALASMLQINTGLVNLFISGCSLRASSIIAISTVLQSNYGIQQLDISNNVLSTASLSHSLVNDTMTHLSIAVRVNTGLKILDLSKMGIDDFVMIHLLGPAIAANKTIETLNLSSNRITRDGGVALCEALANNSGISYLKLSCCAIQDEGALGISKLLMVNFNIKEIYLDFNRITGKGLKAIGQALEQNAIIEYIAVWGNEWDVPSSETFCRLLGGPCSAVMINARKTTPEKTSHPRFQAECTDVTFSRVEGVLQVAHVARS